MTPADAERLKAEEIDSATTLLGAVGKDFDRGVEALAQASGIPCERLMAALAECGTSDLTLPGNRVGRWLHQHALDLLGIAAALIVVFLALRAQGWLAGLGAPWGLTECVPVTAHPLERGRPLAKEDVVRIWQNPEPEVLRSTTEVRGMRLTRDLAAGSSLRRSDFERLELVAAMAIPLGTKLEAKHVALAWTPYAPEALLDPGRAVGRITLRPLGKGAVIRADDLRGAGLPP